MTNALYIVTSLREYGNGEVYFGPDAAYLTFAAAKAGVFQDMKETCDEWAELCIEKSGAEVLAEYTIDTGDHRFVWRIDCLKAPERNTAWAAQYWDNDGERYRDIGRPDDGASIEDIGRYEIVFDVKGERHYCYIDAKNLGEAVEMFFAEHDGITMDEVVEMLEV